MGLAKERNTSVIVGYFVALEHNLLLMALSAWRFHLIAIKDRDLTQKKEAKRQKKLILYFTEVL